MLSAESVLSLVLASISPRFHSLPMLQVVLPGPLVHGPVHVLVHPRPVGLIIRPEPVVDVPVHMDEPALPVRLVLPPLSHVLRAVGPHLLPETVPEPAFPLAGVDGAGLESVGRLLNSVGVDVELVLGQSLLGLLLSEVLAAPNLLATKH